MSTARKATSFIAALALGIAGVQLASLPATAAPAEPFAACGSLSVSPARGVTCFNVGTSTNELRLESGSFNVHQGSGAGPTVISAESTDGNPLSLTITDLSVDAQNWGNADLQAPAIRVAPGTTLNLVLMGHNTLIGGPKQAGIGVPTGAALSISGDGNLDVTGGIDGGAGIGGAAGLDGATRADGAPGEGAGTITINSGTLAARAGESIQTEYYAPAIGGGAGGDGGSGPSPYSGNGGAGGAGGTVTIAGGSTTLEAGADATVIGGGGGGMAGDIATKSSGIGGVGGAGPVFTMTGGNLKINPGSEAGIGSGAGGQGADEEFAAAGASGTVVVRGGSLNPATRPVHIFGPESNQELTHSVLSFGSDYAGQPVESCSLGAVTCSTDASAPNAYGISNTRTDDQGALHLWLSAAASGNVKMVLGGTQFFGVSQDPTSGATTTMHHGTPEPCELKLTISAEGKGTVSPVPHDGVEYKIQAPPLGNTPNRDADVWSPEPVVGALSSGWKVSCDARYVGSDELSEPTSLTMPKTYYESLDIDVSTAPVHTGEAFAPFVSLQGLDTDLDYQAVTQISGPVPPAAGSCEGIDWDAAGAPSPVGTPQSIIMGEDGIQRFTLDPITLAAAGCYRIGVKLVTEYGEVAPMSTPSDAVVQVVAPEPEVEVSGLSALAAPDDPQSVVVTSSNLVPGQSYQVASEILGPVQPAAGESCDTADYSDYSDAPRRPVMGHNIDATDPINKYELSMPGLGSEPGCYAVRVTLSQGSNGNTGQGWATARTVARPTVSATVDSELVNLGQPAVLGVTAQQVSTDPALQTTVVGSLVGPVAPNAEGSCVGADFRGANQSVSQVIDPGAVTNGSFTTRLSGDIASDAAPGCYRYEVHTETVDPDSAGGVVLSSRSATAGFRVVAPAGLSLSASAPLTTLHAGLKATIGMSQLTTGVDYELTTQLVGPVPAAADGGCEGVSFDGADVILPSKTVPIEPRTGSAQTVERMVGDVGPIAGCVAYQATLAPAGGTQITSQAVTQVIGRPELHVASEPQVVAIGSAPVVNLGIDKVSTDPKLNTRLFGTMRGPLPLNSDGNCSGVNFSAAPDSPEQELLELDPGFNHWALVLPETDLGDLGCIQINLRTKTAFADDLGNPLVTSLAAPAVLQVVPDTSASAISVAASKPVAALTSGLPAVITASGLAEGADYHVTGELVGPVAPDDHGGCAGANWDDAPVLMKMPEHLIPSSASPTAELHWGINRSGAQVAGCVSYRMTLTPSIGDPVSFEPGDPQATTLLVGQPTIAAQTSAAVVHPGEWAGLDVQLDKLSSNPKLHTTLTGSVLGPVAPNPDGSCAGVDFSAAPHVSELPPTAIDPDDIVNGTFQGRLGRFSFDDASDPVGCYAFEVASTTLTEDVTADTAAYAKAAPTIFQLAAPSAPAGSGDAPDGSAPTALPVTGAVVGAGSGTSPVPAAPVSVTTPLGVLPTRRRQTR